MTRSDRRAIRINRPVSRRRGDGARGPIVWGLGRSLVHQVSLTALAFPEFLSLTYFRIASANAASRSASAQIMPPLKTPAAFAKPAVLPPSNVDSQEQTAGPGLGGAEFGQGRESGPGKKAALSGTSQNTEKIPGLGVMQMKRSGRGGSGVRGGLAGRGVLKSRR